MNGADPHALLGDLLLHLDEDDIGLLLDQLADQFGIDPAGGATLGGALEGAAPALSGGDLAHKGIARVETFRQHPHRTLAGRIRRQYLAPDIIAIRLRHPLSIRQKQAAGKNQGLYL